MEALPGETIPRAEVHTLPDATRRRIARESGRYLGQLHDVEVGLDAFGERVDHERSRPLQGECPPADPAQLVVADGYDRWHGQLRDWFEADPDLLADSRFGDLAPPLRAEQARRLDALPESFEPILGRVDHHWANLLTDRETGTLEGVIGWGETPAVPRGFSLGHVEYNLARDWWIALPDVPDRRPLIRDALLAGYREEATVPPTLTAQRACYQLDMLVRDLAFLEQRAGASDSAIPDERLEEAAATHRAVARAELDRDGP